MQSKIAMLHYTCPPVVGGVEAVMAAHAKLLAARGYPVTILAGRGPDKQVYNPGIQTIIDPLFDSKSDRLLQINRALDEGNIPDDFEAFSWEAYLRLSEWLSEFSTCIVHNAYTMHKNLPLTAALVKLAAKLPVKFIAWTHDLAWADPLYKTVLYDNYPWNLLKQPAPQVTYVTVSPQRQQSLCDIFKPVLLPEQVPVVPNGIALEEFLAINEQTRTMLEETGIAQARREGALLLLLPARITRRKNIEMAIEVAAALKEQGQKVCLVVTGPPGPHNFRNNQYVRELMDLREKNGVKEEVIFLIERWQEPDGNARPVEDQMVADLFRYFDAMFFPSTQEGFGIPILEAAMARLPVFCSDIPPLRQIAGEYATYFAPDANPSGVAKQLIEALKQNPAFLLRQETLDNFTWDNIFERSIKPLLW